MAGKTDEPAGNRRVVALFAGTALVVFAVSLYIAWSVRSSEARRSIAAAGAGDDDGRAAAHQHDHDGVATGGAAGEATRPPSAGRPGVGVPARPPGASASPASIEDDPRHGKPAWVPTIDPPADMYDNTTPKFAIPEGGFDKWTGREGTHPKELEMYVRAEGTDLELGLELRRLHWLTSLSRNFNLLMELRGGQPPGTAMEIELSELGAATWTKGDQAYEDVRAKKRSSEEVRRYLRQLQDEYRAAYTSKAGITLEQMDRFFAPGVELP